MSESKRLVKNTAIIALGSLSTKLISFLLLPLYTSLLSAKEYGAMDYATTLATFLVPFASFLMDETVFRFLVDAKDEKEISSDLSHSLAIVLSGCIGFLVLASIGTYIAKYQYAWFLLIYVVCSSITGWESAFFRGTGRMREYSLFNFASGSILIVFNVLCIAILRLGLFGMMIATISAHLITNTVFALKYHIFSHVSFSSVRRDRISEMLRYAFPLIPNRLSWNMVSLSNRVVIVAVLGEAANGLFALANRFSSLINTIYGFFYQSWLESAARVKKNGSTIEVVQYYNAIYITIQNFVFSVISVSSAAIPFVYRVLDNEFSQSLYLVPILMLAVYFDSLAAFIGGVFTAFKDTKVLGKTTVLAAGINLVVCSIGVRFVGIYAAAISTLLGNAAVYLYRRKIVKRYVTLTEDVMGNIIKLFASVAILGAFYYENSTIQLVALCFAIALASYLNRSVLKMLVDRLFKRGGCK